MNASSASPLPSVAVPPALVPTVRAYRTCELATLGRDGTPLTWPVVPLLRADGTLLVTTSIAIPQKAFNVRRDGRVAMLFSDPTSTGRTDLPQVHVRARAVCPDDVVVSPAGYEEFWATLWQRQPSSRVYTSPLMRRAFDWYFMRLMITASPTDVAVDEPLRAAATLQAPAVAGDDAFAQAVRRLPGYSSAVLSTLDATGAPALRRVRPTVDAARRSLVVPAPAGAPDGSRASLLYHWHDEGLSGQRSVLVLGTLRRDDADVARRVPDRVVAMDVPPPHRLLTMVRGLRRSADGYLARRGLDRPAVPWREYRDLAR